MEHVLSGANERAAQTVKSVSGEGGVRRRIGYLLPIAVFIIMAIAFGVGLTLNPKEIPSVLIGKPVPDFDLPAVEGRSLALSSEDLKGEVSLVNVFASWCAACRDEHPLWMALAERGDVPLHGLNHRDQPEDAKRWLDTLGDPYTRTGADIDGRIGIEWGVYGVPETFVVDRDGKIALKHIGAVTGTILRDKIMPVVEKLRRAPQQQPTPEPGS